MTMMIRSIHYFLLVTQLFLSGTALSGSATRRTSIVTGANGYLGKEIIHELLEQESSDQIICLVRPARIDSETKYWQSQSIAGILPYDMLDGGDTLQSALEQVDGPCCVYHVASNFGPTENHEQTALDNVQGTEDLIRTVAKCAPASSRVVLTSSMAAVRGTGQDPINGKFYTSQDWNTVSELGANWGASYQWSKAESERRAIALAETLGLELVTLCPSFVFGPPRELESTSSYSLTLVGQWVRGESQVQSRLFVDVRDVAAAHVTAGTKPDMGGKRLIISTQARVSSKEIASWLMKVCEETGKGDAGKIHYDAEFTGGAIAIGEKEVEAEQILQEELGITLKSVKDTIVGMATTLLSEETKQIQ